MIKVSFGDTRISGYGSWKLSQKMKNVGYSLRKLIENMSFDDAQKPCFGGHGN
jgi:hypothetical protein